MYVSEKRKEAVELYYASRILRKIRIIPAC